MASVSPADVYLRSRNRSSPDLSALPSSLSVEAAQDSDEIGGLDFRNRSVCGAVASWALAVLSTAVPVLTRESVDGHVPPLLIPADARMLAVTTALLALLLMPWALITWRQLRPFRKRWNCTDLYVILAFWLSSAVGAFSLLAAREKSFSVAIVVGTTAFGLAGLSTVGLVMVRIGILCASFLSRSAWSFEPCAARATLAALAVLALVSGFCEASVERVDVHVPRLPHAADGYTICMISDLHAGPVAGVEVVRALVSRVLALRACRAVLLNGDIAEGTVEERAEVMRELLPLKSVTDGAYYVPGNHEFYNFGAPGGGRAQAAAWSQWWTRQGVRTLNNSHVRLPLDAQSDADTWFVLAGVDDPMGAPSLAAALATPTPAAGDAAEEPAPSLHGSPDAGAAASKLALHTTPAELRPPPTLQAAGATASSALLATASASLPGASASAINALAVALSARTRPLPAQVLRETTAPADALPVVLAAHRPTPQAAHAAAAGVALQLSGHTHGGQLWPVHWLAAKASGGFLSGLYRVNGTQLYVSDGAFGSYMTRLRLLSRGEITQVRLRSRPCGEPKWREARIGLVLAKGFAAVAAATVCLALGRWFFGCLFRDAVPERRRSRSDSGTRSDRAGSAANAGIV
eukprot:TRINITY_DN4977_c0_g5_i2.p1 TRINITY_DN4977_c0_g5~~TRINITY_DN4977_c0_g5_i2.p1  ORF type:complete len:672 (-),score=125.77 TRINITY_DN4977_c0_g5_i2:16-1923(-)